jgi:hypothetical protein
MCLFSRLRLYFLAFILLFTGIARAQDGPPVPLFQREGFGVEANVLAGQVIKHTVKFTAPIPPLSTAFDVNFVWQTYGKADWQQRRKFPMVGLGITYTNYGNDAVFGQCVGIYPNLQIPLIRWKKMEWTFRLGDGLGYVTRKYQTIAPADTINNAIGSHLNDFAVFMTDLRYHVNNHWQLQVGANFTHISNADYHQPNLGVNMGGGHIGVQYFPASYKPKPIVRDLPKLPNRWLLQMTAAISYKEARATGNPILPTYMGTAYISRRWLGKNKFYGGIDYAFHNDVLGFLDTYCDNLDRKKDRSWDGSFIIGNEFLVGRLGLITQIGVYYHQTYLSFDPVCEKIGGNFYLIRSEHGPIKELFVSAMLLTHLTVAELAQFGVGVGM